MTRSGNALEQRRRDQPVEAGEDDQLDARGAQRVDQRRVERLAGGERAVVDHARRDAGPRGALEAARRRRGSRCTTRDATVEAAVGDAIEDRLQVGAPSGDEHAGRDHAGS